VGEVRDVPPGSDYRFVRVPRIAGLEDERRNCAREDEHHRNAAGTTATGLVYPDSGRSPSRLQVIDTRKRRVLSTTGFDLQLEGGALSPDGRRLYLTATPTKGWGSSVQVYDTRENRVVAEVKIDFGYYAFAMQPVVSPDGHRVFLTMVNEDGAVRILDTQTLRMTDAIKPPGGASAIAFSPDGNRLYCVGGYGDQARVTTVDTTSLKPIASALLGAMTAGLP
jgi:DNA-binding beta-propeller fold protein YncE